MCYHIREVFTVLPRWLPNPPRRQKNSLNDMKLGQPRRFFTGDEFLETMFEYLQNCYANQRFPNIAGFCVWSDITYETFYQQKNYYPEHFEKAQVMLEDNAINSKAVSEAMRIFYLKNKFKYKDRLENEIVTPEPIRINMSALTDDELMTLKALTEKTK